MSEEKETALIKKLASELATASHQSKDKEVSGLFRDIRDSIKGIETQVGIAADNIAGLKDSVDELEKGYISFDKRSVNYDQTTKIVNGLVGLLLTGAVGAIMALIFV